MRSYSGVLFAGAIAALASSVSAQEQVVASLPFLGGQTAGPNATDFQPPMDDHDLWVIEDFGISSDINLTHFESLGTVWPGPQTIRDLTVRIYDDLPTNGGHIILSSVPGTGHVVPNGAWSRFMVSFGGQFLPAGSYYVAWTTQTLTNSQIGIYWAQSGPHAVGGGLPDNAWNWNPGGFYGYPNNIRHVPANLEGTGMIGVNFAIYGVPGCYPNCDGSTAAPILNVNDFICFQTKFSNGDAYANCDGSTTPPILNVNDFICFQTKFSSGCP